MLPARDDHLHGAFVPEQQEETRVGGIQPCPRSTFPQHALQEKTVTTEASTGEKGFPLLLDLLQGKLIHVLKYFKARN